MVASRIPIIIISPVVCIPLFRATCPTRPCRIRARGHASCQSVEQVEPSFSKSTLSPGWRWHWRLESMNRLLKDNKDDLLKETKVDSAERVLSSLAFRHKFIMGLLFWWVI